MTIRDVYEASWRRKISQDAPSIEPGSRSAVALALLPGGRRLLDVGCGDGGFLLQAGDRYPELWGVDISEEAVGAARARGLEVSRVDINEEPLPFPDGAFDTVISLDVIEHVIDPRRFVAELVRVVEPGGHLLLSTPNIRYLKRIAQLVFTGRFPGTSGDPVGFDGGHLHYFTVRDVLELMRQAGLRPERTIGVIPSRRLAFLRPFAGARVVHEWLAPGMVIQGRKR
jgi:methionine biosynthesis protein MetW